LNSTLQGRKLEVKVQSLKPEKSMAVSLLTGGGDKPYALGLTSSLVAQGIAIDFIGSDEVNGAQLDRSSLIRSLNLRGDQRPGAALLSKVLRVFMYYARLLRYAATAEPRIFHILWNNKFEWFDRTLLLIYYRCLGKHIAFTAHNVNARVRDQSDTPFNRLTLRMQYRLVDHIFVHTPQMKREIQKCFGVADSKISIIPFGINNTVPDTDLSRREARARLGLSQEHKVLLFFGNIAPYKGLEYLVEAVTSLAKEEPHLRLIIAGRPKNDSAYWARIYNRISETGLRSQVLERIEYIPDADTEVYFKAADAVVLPYLFIFQSGVLFLGYNFGLPAIATDVGTLRDDIIPAKTGFLCRPNDSADLAKAIKTYFASDLYAKLASRRKEIRDFARERYSWKKVGEITESVYRMLLEEPDRRKR
jgi:D-inositol-3-phosphate glycosyltransferase